MEELVLSQVAKSEVWLGHAELVSVLVREDEVAAAKKQGRQKTSTKHMKMLDEAFHSALHTSVPAHNVVLSDVQLGLSGERSDQVSAALQFQEAVLKQMKQDQADAPLPADITTEAVLHNLRKLQRPERTLVELPDALLGPAHVAKLLLRKAEERFSKPSKAFKFNEDQVECVAMFAARLQTGFEAREDPSQVSLLSIPRKSSRP